RAWAAAWLQTRGTSELRLEITTDDAEAGETPAPPSGEDPFGQSPAAEAGETPAVDSPAPRITSARLTQRDGFAPDGEHGTLRPNRLVLAAFDEVDEGGLRLRRTWEVEVTGASAEVDGLVGEP